MICMGIDYGDKRTGIAVTDGLGHMAFGVATLSEGGMRNTALAAAKIASERKVEKIIVGLPKNMDGSEGESAKKIRAFADILAEYTNAEILFADERLSTAQAHRYMNETDTRGKKRKAAIDTLSAQIILQSYLDKNKNR